MSAESPLLTHQLFLDHIGPVTVTHNPADDGQCVAFTYGALGDSPLVRIQSRCLYGEVFRSAECDCGGQLALSWRIIATEGYGMVVYLDQEGCGSGLLAKARAYQMKAAGGEDTFTAYQKTGLEEDSRSYRQAAEMLRRAGVSSVRLMTNNPDEVAGLQAAGITVARVPLLSADNPHSSKYLDTKRAHGHWL